MTVEQLFEAIQNANLTKKEINQLARLLMAYAAVLKD